MHCEHVNCTNKISIAVITCVFAVSLCPTALMFRISSIIFLLWFFLEVIGVLKLLGHLVQVFLPQTRSDWAVEQSLWQVPWQINHFYTCYVIRTNLWNNFNFDNAVFYCSKRHTNIKKLMSWFSKCVLRCKTLLRIKFCKWDGFQQQFILSLQC